MSILSAIPTGFRRAIKPLVPEFVWSAYIRRRWRQPDIDTWPPDGKNHGGNTLDFEYSVFSQNGEDGILRHLFDCIGFGPRNFVEFGFSPRQSNCLRLMLYEKFSGLFIDGSTDAVNRFNRVARACGIDNVVAVAAFLDLENLEGTIQGAGFCGDIDVLSIDVDGNDYWFWKNLNVVSPRVVAIEYNASLGPERSVSVPYAPDFDRLQMHESGLYCGASLAALEKLGREKEYSLVGCDSAGVNAFFVRNDCMSNELVAVSPEQAFRPHRARLERGLSTIQQFSLIDSLPFVEV